MTNFQQIIQPVRHFLSPVKLKPTFKSVLKHSKQNLDNVTHFHDCSRVATAIEIFYIIKLIQLKMEQFPPPHVLRDPRTCLGEGWLTSSCKVTSPQAKCLRLIGSKVRI